ncbi:MAG: hypothetical protein IJ796_08290 [Lachnospiraceae bacterium]|nr:hypothetical protein [Lachnospiraceae bacterium]
MNRIIIISIIIFLNLSGNLIVFYDFGCDVDDEEIAAMYFEQIEWIKATF